MRTFKILHLKAEKVISNIKGPAILKEQIIHTEEENFSIPSFDGFAIVQIIEILPEYVCKGPDQITKN